MVGERQGGLVAVLLGQPLGLEWAWRSRATTPMELGAFRHVRHALPVQGIIAIDPAIARGFPKSDSLKVALPDTYAMQPRGSPRFVVAFGRPRRDLADLIDGIGTRDSSKSLAELGVWSTIRRRVAELATCGRAWALQDCTSCEAAVHLACVRLSTPEKPIICKGCKAAEAPPDLV